MNKDLEIHLLREGLKRAVRILGAFRLHIHQLGTGLRVEQSWLETTRMAIQEFDHDMNREPFISMWKEPDELTTKIKGVDSSEQSREDTP